MPLNTNLKPAILRARLQIAPSVEVCAALKDYGDKFKQRLFFPTGDDELERLLLERNDQLINLSLAQAATNSEVIKRLWHFANSGQDATYCKGLRLAVLSGNNPYILFSGGSVESEVNSKLFIDNNDESAALLSNPHTYNLIELLFNGEPPFDQIDPNRRAFLVNCAAQNPLITIDESNSDGPDLLSWGIQKSILTMIETAPLNESWLVVLSTMLDYLDPDLAAVPNSDMREVFARWGTVVSKKDWGDDKNADQEGYWTPLSKVDEFRCKVAAIYGKRYTDNGFEYFGTLDAQDTIMRCAAYGNLELTLEQMQAGYDRDQFVFTFAVLHNDSVFWNPKKRAMLERMTPSNQSWIYKQRCEQIHGRQPHFSISLVQEEQASSLDESKATEDMKMILTLTDRVDILTRQIKRLNTFNLAMWIAIGIFILSRKY